LQTALSLAGPGNLAYIVVKNLASTSVSGVEVKVTIDGAVIFDPIVNLSALQLFGTNYGGLLNITGSITGDNATTSPANWDFKSSLLIELKSDGTNSIQVAWGINK
jgi:hypothetical protein